jgi:choline dehydrogenase
MVCIRGNHGDYDEWRQRGCEGWDWILSCCGKKAQNQTRGADDFHGIGGPLQFPTSRAASNSLMRC